MTQTEPIAVNAAKELVLSGNADKPDFANGSVFLLALPRLSFAMLGSQF